MSPKPADVLRGLVVALTESPSPEAGLDYHLARIGMVGMLAAFAAQEAERGVAARVFENAAMAAILLAAQPLYDAALGGALARLPTDSGDLTLTALDRRNAELRITLIALHAEVEARGDMVCDRDILALYEAMARARRLDLPSLAG
jgi:hypothetical protein